MATSRVFPAAMAAAIANWFDALPPHVLAWGTKIGTALLILVAFAIGSSIAVRVLRRFATRAGPGREDVLLMLAQVARSAILVIGVLTALGTAGVDVSAMVAGLGLTGFALGFAFRDALSNLLAGTMILFYRPFRKGDHIHVAGSEGHVREVNLRYTVVENETARILIPNSNLLTNPISVRQSGPSSRTAEPETPPTAS